MSRSAPNWKGTGYNDDRRRSSWDSYNKNPHKPANDRVRDRDHDRDRDRPPIRRDSRDARDARDTRDVRDHRDSRESRNAQDLRSPRDPRRDADPPRPPRLDTTMQDGPRRPASVNTSPASSRGDIQSTRPTPTELFPEKIGPSFATPNTPASATPFTPKAKDPKLQGLVETVYKLGETWQERQSLKLRRDKILREAPQRQQEAAKLGGKSADFPPYLEFEARFKKSEGSECAVLNKQIKSIDQRYVQDLEEVVSSFSSQTAAKPPKLVATKDPSVSALETKFAEFVTRADQQQNQITAAQTEITALLDANIKSGEDFEVLRTGFEALKSDYGELKDENSRLKQQVASLDAELRSAKLAQNAIPAGEFKQTMSALEGLAGKVNEQSKSSKMLRERLEAIVRERETSTGTLQTISSKVEELGNQIDALDTGMIDEIIEAWVDHDVKHKVLSHEEYVNSMRYGPNSFDTTIQGIRREMQSLQLQRPNREPAISQASSAAQPTNQTLEVLLQEKLGRVERSLKLLMKKHMAESENVFTEMIDDGERRIQVLEDSVNNITRRTSPDQNRGLEAYIVSLESRIQSTVTDLVNHSNLAARVSALEEKRLGHRIDRIDLELSNFKKEVGNNVGQLENHLQELASISSSPAAVYDAFIKSEVKENLDDTKKKVEALGMSVRSLDSQWSNISSKQMAERILQQLNPYVQTTEARITKAEDLTFRLQQKVHILEQSVASRNKELSHINELLTTITPREKRPASASPRMDDAAKKRKLETNGHLNPLPPLGNGSANREFQRSAS